jgi:hypothetical protein
MNRTDAGGDKGPDRSRPSVAVGARGQSTTLEYTLSLAIATLVVTGLVTASGGFLSDQRTEVVRTELEVVGQQLATELVAADRLTQSGNETRRVVVNRSLPNKVTGESYTIEVEQDGSKGWINLSTQNPDVSVAVRVNTATDLRDSAVDGGDVSIVYESGKLEVRS